MEILARSAIGDQRRWRSRPGGRRRRLWRSDCARPAAIPAGNTPTSSRPLDPTPPPAQLVPHGGDRVHRGAMTRVASTNGRFPLARRGRHAPDRALARDTHEPRWDRKPGSSDSVATDAPSGTVTPRRRRGHDPGGGSRERGPSWARQVSAGPADGSCRPPWPTNLLDWMAAALPPSRSTRPSTPHRMTGGSSVRLVGAARRCGL